MKVKRKIITIDDDLCDGCSQCTIACTEGAIEIIDGKAKVLSDNLCDGLGACIGDCPQDALKIIEREADEFDEEAVEKQLQKKKESIQKTMTCGDPTSHINEFLPNTQCSTAKKHASIESTESTLTHWPIHIRLVPPDALFLKGADLLVTANCVPIAFPALHDYFLKDRIIMIGCPKFDDRKGYIEKFKEIFRSAGLKSITCLIMEVPCCSIFPTIIVKALKEFGKDIPLEVVLISNRGKIIERKKRSVSQKIL